MGLVGEKIKGILKKPLFVLLILFVPLGGAFLFSTFFEKVESDVKIPVAIADEDRSEFSKHVIKRLGGNERVEIIETTAEEGQRKLLKNEIDSLFIIHEGFMDSLLEEEYEETIELVKLPSSIASGVVREMVASEVTRLTSNVKAATQVEFLYNVKQLPAPKELWKQAYKYTDNQWEPDPLMTINYVGSNQEASVASSDKLTVNRHVALWGFFTLFLSIMTMDWVLKERQTIFIRMKTTQNGLMAYVHRSVAAYALFHVIQTIGSFVLLSRLQIVSHWSIFVLMMLYLFFCISFSLWLASEMVHVGRYYIVGSLAVIGFSILGGTFFPLGELSASLSKISVWIPQHLLLYQQEISLLQIWLEVTAAVIITFILWIKAMWNVRRAQ
ncbi:ABC transporter permease [Priestia megaterium]|nr:ABC transporter permease [Priestia megaterium]